jgi:hypothetical protein
MTGLAASNKTIETVRLQLDQFASAMETCERSVSRTRIAQHATEGTKSVIKTMLSDIESTLESTKDELKIAEELAAGKIFLAYFLKLILFKKNYYSCVSKRPAYKKTKRQKFGYFREEGAYIWTKRHP